jgi:hypothetical protein
MPAKIRIIIVSIIILLGGALFSYCVFSYPVETTAQASIGVNKETPKGGTGRNKSSQNNKTRSKGRSGPKAGAI